MQARVEQNLLRPLTRGGKRDDRISPDRDAPSVLAVHDDKGLRTTLRTPNTKACELGVPSRCLAIGRGFQILDRQLGK